MKTALRIPLLLALLAAAAPAVAGEVQLYATWHAPYGDPRATDTLSIACGDTTVADTLFLSFEPGKSSPTFVGFNGTVMFLPQKGDSLGSFWRAACPTLQPPHMKIAFDAGLGVLQPWKVQGAGGSYWDCMGGGARLRMIYAVPTDKASAIREGDVLTLARIILSRPPAGARCDQPVCIQWVYAELAFEAGAWGTVKLSETEGGSRRFASWNSPGGAVCVPWRRITAVKPWKPKAEEH